MTEKPEFDLVVRNGSLIDGTGSAARPADIAISGESIIELGEPALDEGRTGRREIDAAGLIVAPGFIDVHTHDDNAVLINPRMTPKVSQGVTTVVVGNCGISLAPISDLDPPPPQNLLGGREDYRFGDMASYLKAVNAARPNVNVAALVGHGTLRLAAMDDVDRAASSKEIEAMRASLRASLAAGAIGLSSGLFYKPSQSAPMEEVIGVASVLADAGGIYTTHMRNEHDHVLKSLEETFDTADAAGVPVVISHHKCSGPKNFGRSAETLPKIERARQDQSVGLDAYPYAAGSTVLNPEMLVDGIRTMITWSEAYPEAQARDLSDIAGEWNCTQHEAAERLQPAGAIYFQMDEADVRRILSYPPTMIGSDGLPHDKHPHPRLWSTFPCVLGHYSRDVGLFPLEVAVHKMSGLSARTFGLKDRGEIRPGAFADIVLFNADTVIDVATFEDPARPSAGIECVLVNGGVSFERGAVSETGYGRVVQR